MHPTPSIITLGSRPLVASLALGFVALTSASAQSASNFNVTPVAPEAGTPSQPEVPEPTPPTDEVGPVSGTPSRFIGEADLPAYLRSLTATFSIRNRETDPFGQFQDPSRPVIKPTLAKTPQRRMQVTKTPFPEIMRKLKITTIMPGDQTFLIGPRTFKQGGTIDVAFRGKKLKVEIVTVAARQIEFRDLESGDTASLSLDLLPIGMTPGTSGITAPGMIPDGADAPIDLDSGIY